MASEMESRFLKWILGVLSVQLILIVIVWVSFASKLMTRPEIVSEIESRQVPLTQSITNISTKVGRIEDRMEQIEEKIQELGKGQTRIETKLDIIRER